jgi:hypothetical protein
VSNCDGTTHVQSAQTLQPNGTRRSPAPRIAIRLPQLRFLSFWTHLRDSLAWFRHSCARGMRRALPARGRPPDRSMPLRRDRRRGARRVPSRCAQRGWLGDSQSRERRLRPLGYMPSGRVVRCVSKPAHLQAFRAATRSSRSPGPQALALATIAIGETLDLQVFLSGTSCEVQARIGGDSERLPGCQPTPGP